MGTRLSLKLAITSVFALLTVASPVAAKTPLRAVIVGADGRWATLPPAGFEQPPAGEAGVSIRGGYILVYTLMERSLPMRPARLYVDSGAFCPAWNVAAHPVTANCSFVGDATLARVRSLVLRPFEGDAPALRSLQVANGAVLDAPMNELTAVELGLARRPIAARRPARCVAARAVWTSSVRPSSFCLSPAGAWSRGRLWRVPAVAFDFLVGG